MFKWHFILKWVTNSCDLSGLSSASIPTGIQEVSVSPAGKQQQTPTVCYYTYIRVFFLLLSATEKNQAKIKLFWGNRLQNYIWNSNNENILENKVQFYTQIQIHIRSFWDLKVQLGYKPCNYFMAWVKAFPLHLYPVCPVFFMMWDSLNVLAESMQKLWLTPFTN